MEVTDPSHFGTITFGETETITKAAHGMPDGQFTYHRTTGQWRPPERIARFLPEGTYVPLACYTVSDGLRRIVPDCGFENLIDLGAKCGPAILHAIRGFDPERDFSYRAMHFIHQFVRGATYGRGKGMQEHLTRQFAHSRDLHVRPPGRLADNERDVLPDNVGLNMDGEGKRLSVAQLTETGRQAAREAGSHTLVSKNAIRFGLFEAAKRNPLRVEPDRLPALIQTALFNVNRTDPGLSEEFVEIVMERLLEAIHSHINDPQERFEAWLYGANSSVIKQIAKQRRARGGKLPQDDVREAFLHLGWRAYTYVGQGVHSLMRTIRNAMPDPLNEQEQRIFSHMHESQPYYGNLPLTLLAERSDALGLAIQAIWNEPENEDHVPVLHRLLAYYADMARRRRAADRRSKQQCQANSPKKDCTDDRTAERKDDRHVSSVPLIENLHSPSSTDNGFFADVAEHIRELTGLVCDNECENWDYLLESESDDCLTIDMRCECGRVVWREKISRDRFVNAVDEVLQES